MNTSPQPPLRVNADASRTWAATVGLGLGDASAEGVAVGPAEPVAPGEPVGRSGEPVAAGGEAEHAATKTQTATTAKTRPNGMAV
jgi:hypothetical protein